MDPTVVIALITGSVTVLTSAIAAVVSIMSLRRSEDNSAKLDVVKSQNDGLVSRLELQAEKARGEAKSSASEASTARAATVAAVAAGIEGVAEANRTSAASAVAVKEGAQAAIEPIAEQAVAKGAETAVANLNREEQPKPKT